MDMKPSYLLALGVALVLPAVYFLVTPREAPTLFPDDREQARMTSVAAPKTDEGDANSEAPVVDPSPRPIGLVGPRPVSPKTLPPEAQSLARAVERAEAEAATPGPADGTVTEANALIERTDRMLAEKGYTPPDPNAYAASGADGSRSLEALEARAQALRERLDAR
jgi:hypothetical protein